MILLAEEGEASTRSNVEFRSFEWLWKDWAGCGGSVDVM